MSRSSARAVAKSLRRPWLRAICVCRISASSPLAVLQRGAKALLAEFRLTEVPERRDVDGHRGSDCAAAECEGSDERVRSPNLIEAVHRATRAGSAAATSAMAAAPASTISPRSQADARSPLALPRSSTQPTSGCRMPAPRKMPVLTTEVAMPEYCAGFASFAIVHDSVKPGDHETHQQEPHQRRPDRPLRMQQPRQPRQRVQQHRSAHHAATAAESVRDHADAHRSEGHAQQQQARVLSGRDSRHAVCVLQVGHGPQSGEGKKAAADADIDDKRRPGRRVCQHATESGKPRRTRTDGRRRVDGGEAAVLGPIAYAPPGGERENPREHRERDEDRAPGCLRDDPRERRAGDHGARGCRRTS